MPTDFVKFQDGSSAFITRSDDDNCQAGGEHDFSGTLLTYRTRRGEERYISGDHYYRYKDGNNGLPKREHMRMRVIMGQSCCIKCGCPYTHAHNPYFL